MNTNLKKCELCELETTSLCFQCNMYLCDSCFKYIHEKKAKNNHKKEKIDNYISIDIKCPIHPEERICLFCSNEKGKLLLYYFYFNYRIMLFNVLL